MAMTLGGTFPLSTGLSLTPLGREVSVIEAASRRGFKAASELALAGIERRVVAAEQKLWQGGTAVA